jgi:hypothetical protein
MATLANYLLGRSQSHAQNFIFEPSTEKHTIIYLVLKGESAIPCKPFYQDRENISHSGKTHVMCTNIAQGVIICQNAGY